MSAVNVTDDRHPSVKSIAQWFDYEHLPAGAARAASQNIAVLAQFMIDDIPDSPELSAGLRHLLEAKDCLVRAAIEGARG